jgi:cytochrome P450
MEVSSRRYGDVVTFRRPFAPPWVLAFHPGAVEQIFRAPAERLTKDEGRMERLSPVIGESSMALREGEEYKRHRRTIRPALHGNSLLEYQALVRDAADRMIDSWPVGKPFALLPFTTSLAVDLSTRLILGVEDRATREEIAEQMRKLTDPDLTLVGGIAHTVTRGRLRSGSKRAARRQRKVVDRLLLEVIAERRAAPDQDEGLQDILSALIRARDEGGRALSDQEVCDHVVTLMIGGRINPGVAIAWSFDLLLRNPDALSRLRTELAAGDESYLEAVVKETLRVRSMSLTPVGRIVYDEPYRVGDYELPPGTHLSVGAAVIHSRADIHPEPEVFRPERFLGSQRAYIYTWIPFGGGTRRCPGADFSMMEMAEVIRRVLERAHLEPVGRRPDKPSPRGATLRRVITYVPARGTRVIQVRPPEPARAPAMVADAA